MTNDTVDVKSDSASIISCVKNNDTIGLKKVVNTALNQKAFEAIQGKKMEIGANLFKSRNED